MPGCEWIYKFPSSPFLKHARSLVFNILSNALKFRSKDRKPVVTVSSYLKNDKTRLSFADNSIDIRKADQSKVFMIFKRFNPEVAGRGVGMCLVKRIIDLNDRGIYLKNREHEVQLSGLSFLFHNSKMAL